MSLYPFCSVPGPLTASSLTAGVGACPSVAGLAAVTSSSWCSAMAAGASSLSSSFLGFFARGGMVPRTLTAAVCLREGTLCL